MDSSQHRVTTNPPNASIPDLHNDLQAVHQPQRHPTHIDHIACPEPMEIHAATIVGAELEKRSGPSRRISVSSRRQAIHLLRVPGKDIFPGQMYTDTCSVPGSRRRRKHIEDGR